MMTVELPLPLLQMVPESLRNHALLPLALTHRSAGPRHNERLEFLGDAVLGLVIADLLCERLPEENEGNLTRLRSALVNRGNLALLAREAGLSESLRLGQGEKKSGGKRRESILADVLEALIGASYLSSGYEETRLFVERLFAEQVQNLPDAETLKDPKTRLQELTQRQGLGLPEYRLLQAIGPDHERIFTAEVILPGSGETLQGRGRSRRHAEQDAAASALQRLLVEGS